MKKLKILNLFVVLALVTSLFSCSDDDEVKLATVNVTVKTVENIKDITCKNIEVVLKNTANEFEVKANTDENGKAIFSNVAPGTYALSSSMTLTPDQASASMGYYEEITLNSVKDNLTLTAGQVQDLELILDGKPSSSLVIKEIYAVGANDPTWSIMFKDQFIEIYNNSSEVVYADGLYIANLAPDAVGYDPNDEVLGLDLKEFVYADKISQIPGTGQEHPIEPGKSIVIAFNAVDWTDGGTNSEITIDLSKADFELYAVDWLTDLGREGNPYFDIDNVDVPNMNPIYLNMVDGGSLQFNPSAASVAIFRSEQKTFETIVDPTSSETDPIYFAKIKVTDILDGVDYVWNAEAANFKRLPASVDAGFTHTGGATYSSKSIRRKVIKEVEGRKILMDTNNSANDFEIMELPTPRKLGDVVK